MRIVTAAFTAVSRGEFDELAPRLSPEIDWRGLPGQDGQVTHLHGYATELEARAALDAGLPAAASADNAGPAEESTTSAEMT